VRGFVLLRGDFFGKSLGRLRLRLIVSFLAVGEAFFSSGEAFILHQRKFAYYL
jgi:hypothetical protein